ncbi:hypothetical protein [Egicoccus sp. AB-alg2]|uniref:hypothetical protein n=1 Tax=Egicoccus sp. AB-alg2 TaxID=3242693 RepID=UPI00359E43A7
MTTHEAVTAAMDPEVRRELARCMANWEMLANELATMGPRTRAEQLAVVEAEVTSLVLPALEQEQRHLAALGDRGDDLLADVEAMEIAARRLHHVASAGELHPAVTVSTISGLVDSLRHHLRRTAS